MVKQIKLTVANVSKLLKSAGHSKSESHPTAVRGWHDITPGFRIRAVREPSIVAEYITVEYVPARHDRDDRAARRAKVDGFRASLLGAFNVDVAEHEYVTTLVVTSKSATPAKDEA